MDLLKFDEGGFEVGSDDQSMEDEEELEEGEDGVPAGVYVEDPHKLASSLLTSSTSKQSFWNNKMQLQIHIREKLVMRKSTGMPTHLH